MGDNIRYKLVPAGDINKSEIRTSRKINGWKAHKKYSYVAVEKKSKGHSYWTSNMFNQCRKVDHNWAQQMQPWYATSYAMNSKARLNLVLSF